jgi:rubrerythrin
MTQIVEQRMGVFQCEKRLKVLADEYHSLLNRKAARQEKQHAQALKSVVSEARTWGTERIAY